MRYDAVYDPNFGSSSAARTTPGTRSKAARKTGQAGEERRIGGLA
jgi:hypothetical protein